jgi:hypothetical protein
VDRDEEEDEKDADKGDERRKILFSFLLKIFKVQS